MIIAGEHAFQVSYSIDWFADTQRRTGSGQVDGELAALCDLIGDEPAFDATLKLADGEPVSVTLSDMERDGGSFETR